jgi:hypothetical protein
MADLQVGQENIAPSPMSYGRSSWTKLIFCRLALSPAVVAVALAAAATAGASADGTHSQPAELTGLTSRPDGGLVVRQGNDLASYLADGAPDPEAPPIAVPAGRG